MQFAYINLLRSVAVIVVVFFHVYALFWQKGIYGPADDSNPWYLMIRCGLITIAIPLYFSLSGYCFAWSFKQGQYQGIKEVIKKKAKRLLLPFFVFSAVMIAISDGTISIGSVPRGNLAHLWFLPSLFWCFIFGYILLRYMESRSFVCIPFLLLTSMFPMTDIIVPRIFGLQSTYHCLCWFVLGLLIYTYYTRLSAWFKCCPKLYLIMLIWPVMLTIDPIEYGDTQSLLMLLATATMITAICIINKTGFYLIKWGGVIGKRSFGIYLIHFVLLTFIDRNFENLINTSATYSTFIVPILGVSIFIISLVLTKLLAMTKIGRMII